MACSKKKLLLAKPYDSQHKKKKMKIVKMKNEVKRTGNEGQSQLD